MLPAEAISFRGRRSLRRGFGRRARASSKVTKRALIVPCQLDRKPESVTPHDSRGSQGAQKRWMQVGFHGIRSTAIASDPTGEDRVSTARTGQVERVVVEHEPQRQLTNGGQ